MGSFIKLNKEDVYLTNYTAHKDFEASSDGFIENYYVKKGYVRVGYTRNGVEESGIKIYKALDTTGSLYNIDTSVQGYDERHLHRSLNHMYYKNRESGDLVDSFYDTYTQSTLEDKISRNLSDNVKVYSIPQNICGEGVKPGSLSLYGRDYIYVEDDYEYDDYVVEGESFKYVDNGEGTLIDNDTGDVIGDIIYPHGLIVLTNLSAVERTNLGVYNIKWKSTYTINTFNFHCKAKSDKLNFSQNPSTYDSDKNIKENVKDKYFSPYITSVGIYNDANELLAVGKMSQPIPKSRYNDMVFDIIIDN